jgi:N-acetylmuramic acid 6-phosphate (MurNAc-6-P) etherase
MANGLNKFTVQEGVNAQLGQGGYDIVTNAAVSAHTYVAITILVGTEVISGNTASGTVTATSIDTSIWDTITTTEVPVGCTIYGRWSAVTIGPNDTAIVYRG